MFNAEQDIKKWAPVLDHADAPEFKDNYRKAVTAKLLENTELDRIRRCWCSADVRPNGFDLRNEGTLWRWNRNCNR